jgi:predicted component of type VI protein secretion system
MVRDSQQHASRGLHVVSLADKTLKLGRGHESDVRIADVSISRCHATIRFSNGSFLLEDNNSKFGTLIALKKPRLLEANAPISIQMGRTVVALTAHPNPDGSQASSAFLPQMMGSSAEDERALRLSLLTRSPSAWGDGAAGDGDTVHAVRTTASNFTEV